MPQWRPGAAVGSVPAERVHLGQCLGGLLVAPFGSLAEPVPGKSQVLGHALAVSVDVAQVVLGIDKSALHRPVELGVRLLQVSGHAVAVEVVDPLQRAADGAAAGMSAEGAQACRSGRTCGPAPGERSRFRAVADRSTHRAAGRFIEAGRRNSAHSGRANTARSPARRSRSSVPEARSTPGLIVAGRRRCQSQSTRTVCMRGKGGQL